MLELDEVLSQFREQVVGFFTRIWHANHPISILPIICEAMPSVEELIRERTDLANEEIERIHDLLGSWQLIADLSFADLLLWCRQENDLGFLCVAQMRPYTAQTLHPEDAFGKIVRPEELPIIDRAFAERRMWLRDEPILIDGVPVQMEAIPVSRLSRTIAVITKESAPLVHRRPGRLEENYLECAAQLSGMVEEGIFPFEREPFDPEVSPRVGDGLIRLDRKGRVVYASPNAMSAYRRLGITSTIEGEPIDSLGLDVSGVSRALATGSPAENEIDVGGTVVLQRAFPFKSRSAVTGALLLLRDVTELRHRERVIQRKEAVILEIHHRVKNNLQTIASLLRLQSRRLSSPEAKSELEEATRRIASIALVHETLAAEGTENVNFEKVARQIIRIVAEGLTIPEKKVEFEFQGEAGELPAEIATSLSVVLVELLQNAVEHAFDSVGGRVEVRCNRDGELLQLAVIDNGRGLPGSPVDGLGLQIVRALVVDELQGKLEMKSNGGTSAALTISTRRRI